MKKTKQERTSEHKTHAPFVLKTQNDGTKVNWPLPMPMSILLLMKRFMSSFFTHRKIGIRLVFRS